VWASRAQAKLNFIEPRDVEAAMQTAAAIGDDRLQRRAQGRVVPDSFTHGWFTIRLNGGRVGACNTFDGGAGETIGRNAR
jgi:predicted metalloprotease